jgi:hypothetical protein
MAILKSRFSKDGIIFSDIVFNNATIQIEMSSDNQVGTSNGDHKKNVEKNNVNRVRRNNGS